MHNIRLLAPRSHGGHNSISISGTQPRSRHRPHRRITGYHNPFDDEQSPSYEQGHVPELSLQKPTSFNGQTQAPQRPPPYSCTVSIEGVVEMRFERTSPFNTVKDAKWENVYVRLQGTMLELRQAKTHGLFTPGSVRGTVTGEPGKLLKRFTMQHAEAGVAADYRKVEMIPKSPISQLLPASTIKELQRTDPQQFEVMHNYVSRLRLEGNQFLFRFKTSEERSEWLSQICAAIDIAPPLETRGEPRYHTLPRRRRRDHHYEPSFEDTEHDASLLLAEQEQILQSRYPHLANSDGGQNDRPNSTEESRSDMNSSAMGEGETEEDDPDREDLDPAFMGGGDNEEAIAEEDEWHGETGNGPSHLLDGEPRPQRAARKWRPSINLDPSRDARYRRRCMPMLVYNSRYANDIIYCDGKRVTIDWKSRTLQAWPTPPPAYNASARDGDDTNSSMASSTVRHLAKQSSVTDFAPSTDRSVVPRPSMPTAASSADVTDGSEDDRSPTSRMASWKGATSWGRRFKHMSKPSSNTRNIPRSDGTSMNVNKVRSKDSDNWQIKSVPNSGRLLSASLLDERELRNLRV